MSNSRIYNSLYKLHHYNNLLIKLKIINFHIFREQKKIKRR